VVSAPVLIAGGIVTAGIVAFAVRRLDSDRLPQAALFSSVFFAVSLFTVPVGPSSIHLTLSGLMGLVLGWTSAPAILVALILQAVFFGYGGVVVLGVNTMNLAVPAIVCALVFGPFVRKIGSTRGALVLGALAGASAVMLTGVLVCLVLAASGREFLPAAKIVMATFIPLSIIEGAVTAATLVFLKRVSPRLLDTEGKAHG
jgi:cobalt/nickel transport system permease protein